MAKISRRGFFKAGAAAGLSTALPASARPAGAGPDGAAGGGDPDLTFVNGRIHTMDDNGSVVGAVAIRKGRFVAVGSAANPGPGAKVINLEGRTVVPGLIESHTHFVSLANRPGYHVAQWELASSVAEVLAMLAARRDRGDVPPDQFITAMGAGTPRMFAELRLPTLDELDEAVGLDQPVFLYQGGGGPARTNTAGKEFFESLTDFPVAIQGGRLDRHRRGRQQREPRAVPPQDPADVRGQEAQRARLDGLLGAGWDHDAARPDPGRAE